MILIGLNGRARSGKDTAYHTIETCAFASGLRCKRICFADKMKLSGMRALGFEPQSEAEAVALADVLKEGGFVTTAWHTDAGTVKRTVTGRQFWQLYGTEAHRDVFGQDFWVDELLPSADLTHEGQQRALSLMHPDADVLVDTTTRFPNEAERILALGGHVWHIDADERLGPLPEDAHVSEHGLPAKLVSCTIHNSGTLQQFEASVSTAWRLSC